MVVYNNFFHVLQISILNGHKLSNISSSSSKITAWIQRRQIQSFLNENTVLTVSRPRTIRIICYYSLRWQVGKRACTKRKRCYSKGSNMKILYDCEKSGLYSGKPGLCLILCFVGIQYGVKWILVLVGDWNSVNRLQTLLLKQNGLFFNT